MPDRAGKINVKQRPDPKCPVDASKAGQKLGISPPDSPCELSRTNSLSYQFRPFPYSCRFLLVYFVPHVLWWESNSYAGPVFAQMLKNCFCASDGVKGRRADPSQLFQARMSTRQEMRVCGGSTENKLVDDNDCVDDNKGYCSRFVH